MPSSRRNSEASPDRNPTIGFVCPLYRELSAVRAIFDEHFRTYPIYVDGDLESEYYYGRIGSREVVAVSFADKNVGPSWAVHHAGQLLRRHQSLTRKTSACFLVGIAAGIWSKDKDIRLGDVVIATQVVDWTSGKVNQHNEFEATKHAEDVSKYVQYRVPKFCDNMARLSERIRKRIEEMQPEHPADKVLWECPGPSQDILFQPDVVHEGGQACENCEPRIEDRMPREPYILQVHRGLVASGDVVLKDAATREKLRQFQNHKVLAVEMEASGVMIASKKFIIMRGICDYADSHKNKRWQHYAAATAAACSRLWIDDYLLSDNTSGQDSPAAGETISSPSGSDADENQQNESQMSPITASRHDKTANRRYRSRSRSSAENSDRVSNNSSDHQFLETRATPSVEDVATRDFVDTTHLEQRQDSPQDDWSVLLDVEASKANLSVRYGLVKSPPTVRDYQKCRVKFDIQKSLPVGTTNRRIQIIDDYDCRSLWLPNTQVWAKCESEVVTLEFSNCIQRAQCKYGRFDTKDGRALYISSYNPLDPNVQIGITFANSVEAIQLYNLALSRDTRLLSGHQGAVKEYKYCKIAHSMATVKSKQVKFVNIWSKKDNYEICDIASFTNKFDFDVTFEEKLHVCFQYVNKFKYEPVDTEPFPWEPRRKIKCNQDGGPGTVELSGADSPYSILDMYVGSDETVEVISETIDQIVPWRIRAIALGVHVVWDTQSRWKPNFEFDAVQISAWTNAAEIRLLARVPPNEQGYTWIACVFPSSRPSSSSSSVEHTSKFQAEGEQDAIVANCTFHYGDYLARTTLLPEQDGTQKRSDQKSSQPDWKSMKLTFESSSQRMNFEQLFASCLGDASQS